MYSRVAASSENDQGSMNLGSKIAPLRSSIPSSAAATQGIAECLTSRSRWVMRRPVRRSYQRLFRSLVASSSCATRLPDRSFGLDLAAFFLP